MSSRTKERFSRSSGTEHPFGGVDLLLLQDSPEFFNRDDTTTNDLLVPSDQYVQVGQRMFRSQRIISWRCGQLLSWHHLSAFLVLSLMAYLPKISALPALPPAPSTAVHYTPGSSGIDVYSKVLFFFLIIGVCISTAAYVYEYWETRCIESGSIPSSVRAPNSNKIPTSPNFRMLALNAPTAVWTFLCVMNLIMLFLQRPKLVRACEGPNPDIAGLGARLSLWIPAGIVILTAGLGHLHGEETGAKNVHLALFGAVIIYGCNLLIQDTTPVEKVVGAMVLDCLLMIDVVPIYMKECLSARQMIRLANLTQYFGLAVTFLLIQRFRIDIIIPETPNFDSSPTCKCFQIYWWGLIDSCNGISPTLIVYFLFRAIGTLHGSWLSLHYMGLYDECEKSERSDCLAPLDRIQKTVYDSIPATAMTKYQEWIPVIIFSVINLESTLVCYKGMQDIKSWGQTASVLSATITSGSFCYALHSLFKIESVQKRQQIIKDYSDGTAFPRLAVAISRGTTFPPLTIDVLTKLGMLSLAELLQRVQADLLSRSPFGKVRLRTPNHCRLSAISAAWETIRHQYRQWPGMNDKQLGMLLIQSVELGDTIPIADLLTEGASTVATDEHGDTALHIACRLGNVKIVKALIDGGANLEIESKAGWTALHFAISGGRIEVLKCFLGLNCNTSPRAKNGQTPLHLAVQNGDLEILRLILEMKPYVNMKERNGMTPLHLASELEDAEPAFLLLAKDANPSLKNKGGCTPLHLAILCDRKDVVMRILDMGAYIDSQTNDGSSSLMLAVRHARAELAFLLLERGASPNLKDESGDTPLHVACRHGQRSVVKAILDMGVDLHGRDKKSWTPLHCAIVPGNKDPELVRLLLSRQADPNAKDEYGWTPLHLASLNNRYYLVKTLLDSGAHIDSQTNAGSTPLLLASSHATSVETVFLLLARGGNPNIKDENGCTPLHLACHRGWKDVVRGMRRMGADFGAQTMHGWTPLHCAVTSEEEDVNLVSLLLFIEGNPHCKEQYGLTPLHLASLEARVDLAKVLIKGDADIHASENHGLTPLHYAIRYRKYETAGFLLEMGADPSREGIDGFTPLQMAYQIGSPGIVEKMIAKGWDPRSCSLHGAIYRPLDVEKSLLGTEKNPDIREFSRNIESYLDKVEARGLYSSGPIKYNGQWRGDSEEEEDEFVSGYIMTDSD